MISKFLLVHSAFAYKKERMSADRKPIYGTPIELSNVWIDFNTVQIDSSTGKAPSDNGTFYFDLINSKPEGFVPELGMKLVFNDKEMTVNSVKPCYGLNDLEHYECGVN